MTLLGLHDATELKNFDTDRAFLFRMCLLRRCCRGVSTRVEDNNEKTKQRTGHDSVHRLATTPSKLVSSHSLCEPSHYTFSSPNKRGNSSNLPVRVSRQEVNSTAYR
jgi:hypothetical protein